jgi:glyceraldehyde-3-phosphate dehydrogenase (NADP+)
MKMYINGDWTSGTSQMEVRNPYNGEVFDTVPAATIEMWTWR